MEMSTLCSSPAVTSSFIARTVSGSAFSRRTPRAASSLSTEMATSASGPTARQSSRLVTSLRRLPLSSFAKLSKGPWAPCSRWGSPTASTTVLQTRCRTLSRSMATALGFAAKSAFPIPSGALHAAAALRRATARIVATRSSSTSRAMQESRTTFMAVEGLTRAGWPLMNAKGTCPLCFIGRRFLHTRKSTLGMRHTVRRLLMKVT
mmetsp:Transcript_13471/g.39755  ORF Transcript_13471/g.39755 Transcript_13471/m.39755 type:complete len:206 (+) Transcript_13471:306-923(+)